jgi:hypothetical protein
MLSTLRRVWLQAEAFGGPPPLTMAGQRVCVLVQARDARLYVAPLGCETEALDGPCWTDCGTVGWDGSHAGCPAGHGNPAIDRLAAAVQQAWAAEWA